MYEDYIVVILRRIHAANFRGNKNPKTNTWRQEPGSSGIFRRPG
jgi:hypothetical protein